MKEEEKEEEEEEEERKRESGLSGGSCVGMLSLLYEHKRE